MTTELTIDELLTTTRTIRRRLDLDHPADLADVEECLRIAIQAPSGSNEQTWHWIVITDPEVRRQLGEIYLGAFNERNARRGGQAAVPAPPPAEAAADENRRRLMRSSTFLIENLARVPVLIVPCVSSYLPQHPADAQLTAATMYASIFPAVWNFQLALRTRGYGTCLTTLHLARHAQVAELLGIPDGYTQACLLPVARITGENKFQPAARKPLESVMSRDRF